MLFVISDSEGNVLDVKEGVSISEYQYQEIQVKGLEKFKVIDGVLAEVVDTPTTEGNPIIINGQSYISIGGV